MTNKTKQAYTLHPPQMLNPKMPKNESINGETTVRIRNGNTESKELSIMMIII